MDPERIEHLRNQAAALWQKARTWAARLPGKAWLVLGYSL